MIKIIQLFYLLQVKYCLQENQNLISLVVLLRHGHNHSNNEQIPLNQKNQLSSIGQRQLYQLGKFFRNEYKNFFDEQFHYPKNKHISSGTLATIQSSYAFLLGIYDFNSLKLEVDDQLLKQSQPIWKDFILPSNLPKTPLPEGLTPFSVNSFDFEQNYVLDSWNKQNCPRLNKLNIRDDNKMDDLIKFIEGPVNDELKNKGININDITDGKKLDSNVINNLILYIVSMGFQKQYPQLDYQTIERINSLIGMLYQADLFNNKDVLNYNNTFPLLKTQQLITNNWKNHSGKFNGNNINFQSITMNDTNLLSILTGFGFSNYECIKQNYLQKQQSQCFGNPLYSSNISFELVYDNIKQDYFVNVLYNNYQINACKNDRNNCTMEEFEKLINKNILIGDKNQLQDQYCLKLDFSLETNNYLRFFVFITLVLIFMMIFANYKKVQEIVKD